MENDFSCTRLNHPNFKLEAVTSNWFSEAEERKKMFGRLCERKQQCNTHSQNCPCILCISEALEICIALFTSLNISALVIPPLISTVTASLVVLDFCVASRTMAPFWTYAVISSNRTKPVPAKSLYITNNNKISLTIGKIILRVPPHLGENGKVIRCQKTVWTKIWEFHSGKDRIVFRSVRFWGKKPPGMLSLLGRCRVSFSLSWTHYCTFLGKQVMGEARENEFSLEVCVTFRFCCFRQYGLAHIKHEKNQFYWSISEQFKITVS